MTRLQGFLAAPVAALAFTAMAVPTAGQEAVPANAQQAKQCAVWAFAMSDQMGEDAEAREALVYFGNYLVGHFEGSTGQSIAGGADAEAVRAVEADMTGFTETCSALMLGFGNRMMAWGEILDRIGGAQPAKK